MTTTKEIEIEFLGNLNELLNKHNAEVFSHKKELFCVIPASFLPNGKQVSQESIINLTEKLCGN